MICFRCGSEVAEGAPQCGNCGQRFAGTKRTFTATTTSFRALEKRKLRAHKTAEKLGYGIGDVIAQRYEVRDLIGVGPLGAVYRVLDQEIDVDVALKVIHPHLLPDDAARETFSQTIRKVRKLSQQNIVRLYDDDAEGERAFYSMQLLEGLTLRKVIGLRQDKGQRFTVKEIEPVMVQIAMALSHAHRHTIHGDLKPENVLILPDVLKLTDFSAWEAIPTPAFVKAQTEAEMGAYMAPELASGGSVDLRADLFSLGAIFYELLTGRAYALGAPPPSEVLAQSDESGPEGIDAFVVRATAQNPADRYESAEAFIESLATYIDGRELRSVDVRAPRSLLPEDVTRRVQAPAGLQDEESVDIEAPESDAESSFIDEIDDADLEIETSMDRSVDISRDGAEEPTGEKGPKARPKPPSMGPEGPTMPWEAVQAKPALTAEATVEVRQSTAVTAPVSAPWFVRSNFGFVASVFLIVLGVAAAAWFVVRNAQKDRVSPRTVEIRVAPDATGVAQRPSVVVEARAVVPETAPPPPPPTEPPSAIAVSAAPRTDAPRVAAVVAPPTPPPVAPATRAPATEPPPTPATKPPVVAAPKTAAPAPPPAPATKPGAASQPVASAPTGPSAASQPMPSAPGGPSAASQRMPSAPTGASASADKTSCPGGTILITTAAFPKGAVKGRDVAGAEGVALARSGKAYCIDAHEYPGSGRSPKTSVAFEAANGMCKAGGKRLCSDGEWQRACRGGGGDFPYGKEFDAGRCNTEDAGGEARSVSEAGKFNRCRSAVGAYDMSGNVAEWTSDQTVRGGDYTSADEDAACSAGGKRAAGSARPTIGFRCCSDLP